MNHYIPYVLENDLVISRFMYDHAIIILAMISFHDNETRKIYEEEKQNYEKVFLEIIKYSYNKVTVKFLNSDILITDYTDLMAGKTCNLFKVDENSEICLASFNLLKNSKNPEEIFSADEYGKIRKNNILLMDMLKNSLNKLKQLLKNVRNGVTTIFFSESFIEHLIEETEIYIYTLDFLDRQITYTPTYVYKCKYYFNLFLKTHAIYLKNMMFPISFKNCEEANEYISKFDEITGEFDDNISPEMMRNLNNKTKVETEKFIIYNTELIENIISSKYYASAIPLLNEHILRESKYITYQLDIFESLL